MPAEQIQTLNRAISVMDCFTQEQPELGVREIARLVNLSSSATGRLLAALKALGVLSQNPQTRTYSMGARVLTWAGIYNTTLDIRNRALPFIHELHQSTRETISLYVLDGSERLCIERLESPQTVRIVTRIGKRLPLYAGSAGKVILAYLPEARQKEIIDLDKLVPLTDKTIVDPAALRRELEKVRQSGCSVSFGEWISDAAGVAAPIFHYDGEVIGALSISGPVGRFTDDIVRGYCVEVKDVAARISASLGYPGGKVEEIAKSSRSV